MTWGDVEQRLKTIKEALLIVAILVGGAWGFYRFVVLESASARIAYEKAISDSKAFGIQVQIDASSFKGKTCIIMGSIKFQNLGSEIVSIHLTRAPPIMLAKVNVRPDGHFIDKGSGRSFWLDNTDGRNRDYMTIVPGRTMTAPFVAEADAPGLYMVRFLAPAIFTRTGDPKIINLWGAQSLLRACPPKEEA